METEEIKILEECQAGELHRFTLLYDRYSTKIYRFIYYKTHHKETAQDLTSVTFTKAIERIKSYDKTKGGFSTWLYQIARNTVVDHYRTTKTTANIEDIWDLADENINVLRDVNISMTTAKIRQAMENLKPKQREIIMLRIWEDMPYREIAEIIGSSEDAAKMAFSRAIKELRQQLPAAAFLSLLLLFK